MNTKPKTEFRIGRTIYGTWVVEPASGLIHKIYETCNRKKAEGVLEYLSRQTSAKG